MFGKTAVCSLNLDLFFLKFVQHDRGWKSEVRFSHCTTGYICREEDGWRKTEACDRQPKITCLRLCPPLSAECRCTLTPLGPRAEGIGEIKGNTGSAKLTCILEAALGSKPPVLLLSFPGYKWRKKAQLSWYLQIFAHPQLLSVWGTLERKFAASLTPHQRREKLLQTAGEMFNEGFGFKTSL